MKAIVYDRYGPPDVLRLKDVETPVPKNNEVLVEVVAASINAADWHLLTADIFLVRLMGMGLFRPAKRILGADIAGRVVSIGSKVERFRLGDKVFGDIFQRGSGGLAEYASAPDSALALKPANISFEQAAASPLAAITALQGLRDKGRIQAGQRVLIHGASGGVGSFAIQIAKHFGAHVTAVCSARNIEQARALGADHVIDYAQEDFAASGQQYDLIFVAYGNRPLSAYKQALTPRGACVVCGGPTSRFTEVALLGPWMSRRDGKTFVLLSAKSNPQDLALLSELLAAGKIVPVIDRRYALSEAADALRYLGEGHARGKIVINVAPGSRR